MNGGQDNLGFKDLQLTAVVGDEQIHDRWGSH
jgi:hypothetical protein